VAEQHTDSHIKLHDLRLDSARALLDRETAITPTPEDASATQYLQSVIDGLCELSLRDPLTGLSNRRHFRAVQERAIDVVARSGEPALLLMLDIDHFKKVNDTYGHPAGDSVLQAVAQTLAKCIRPMDTVARYGGEEFAIVFPNCPATFGAMVAERIRASVEALDVQISPAVVLKVTISIGGAYAPEWIRSTAALWTDRADHQLYRAKGAGRNCVFLDEQQEIFVSAEEKNLLLGHLAVGEPAWIENINDAPDRSSSAAIQRVN
jgi:two-component system cell cycle response regulator